MASGDSKISKTTDKSKEDDFVSDEIQQISHLFSTAPHLVSNILTYLNARDLNNCARVCQLWSKSVELLKSKRRTKSWTFLNVAGSDDEEDLEETQKLICRDTKEFLHSLYTQPKILFMCCSTDFNELKLKIEVNGDGARRRTMTYSSYGDYLRTLLPTDCRMIAIASGGVVGTSSDLKQIFECENDTGVALLCLPDYEGFSIVTNTVDESGEDIETPNINGNRLNDKEFCKGVMNFIAEPDIQKSFVFDLKKDFENAVLAGGMVDSLVPLDSVEGYPAAMHVGICGEKVDVGCVVIRETVHTQEKAEEKIKELKNYKLSEENSFAFMFACVGRGTGLWGENNVESSIFQRHFPNTPLFGFFGNGEIDMDHVSTLSLDEDVPCSKKAKKNQKLFHSFTTIVVLVSIR